MAVFNGITTALGHDDLSLKYWGWRGLEKYVRDGDIACSMKSILDSYHPNRYSQTLNDIDFGDERNRDAYCLLFFTSHYYVVKKMLYDAWNDGDPAFIDWIDRIQYRGSCKLVCVGGGPVPELFAFCSFINDICNSDVKIDCVVYDKYTDWEETSNLLRHHLFLPDCNVTYKEIELEYGELDNGQLDDLSDCDLVTFVKTLSAVNYGLGGTQNNNLNLNVEKLLQSVGFGGMVLFIDNIGGDFPETFESDAKSRDFDRIYAHDPNMTVRVPKDELGAIAEAKQWASALFSTVQKGHYTNFACKYQMGKRPGQRFYFECPVAYENFNAVLSSQCFNRVVAEFWHKY